MPKKNNLRKAISKKLRFEVFKRDSFKCMYCGKSAPEVILHVDHIKPISKGGTNDIVNLITACVSCNLGKGKTALDDKTTLSKTKLQLEELQERREQLEMMIQWQEELKNFKNSALDYVVGYWNKSIPGYTINENGKKNLKKWLRRFSIEELITAIDIAVEKYLVFKEDGTCTKESVGDTFEKIPGICRMRTLDPDIQELYYIRGIIRTRMLEDKRYYDDDKALILLRNAYDAGVSVDYLKQVALEAIHWTDFKQSLIDAIHYKKSKDDGDD